jgi:uncharacterized protein
VFIDSDFEWDKDKAKRNLVKHGIGFPEASTLFSHDPNVISLFDSAHSFDEERYIEIGFSDRGRLLVVVYTQRGDRIRIISARPATFKEEQIYDRG